MPHCRELAITATKNINNDDDHPSYCQVRSQSPFSIIQLHPCEPVMKAYIPHSSNLPPGYRQNHNRTFQSAAWTI